MATRKTDDRPNISIKLDTETMGRIDALVEKLQRETTPGVVVSRSAAFRAAILAGLDVLLKDKRSPR